VSASVGIADKLVLRMLLQQRDGHVPVIGDGMLDSDTDATEPHPHTLHLLEHEEALMSDAEEALMSDAEAVSASVSGPQ